MTDKERFRDTPEFKAARERAMLTIAEAMAVLANRESGPTCDECGQTNLPEGCYSVVCHKPWCSEKSYAHIRLERARQAFQDVCGAAGMLTADGKKAYEEAWERLDAALSQLPKTTP